MGGIPKQEVLRKRGNMTLSLDKHAHSTYRLAVAHLAQLRLVCRHRLAEKLHDNSAGGSHVCMYMMCAPYRGGSHASGCCRNCCQAMTRSRNESCGSTGSLKWQRLTLIMISKGTLLFWQRYGMTSPATSPRPTCHLLDSK